MSIFRSDYVRTEWSKKFESKLMSIKLTCKKEIFYFVKNPNFHVEAYEKAFRHFKI